MSTQFSILAAGILAAGMTFAQTAPTAPAPAHSQPRQAARNGQDRMLARLTMRLNLTADQRAQVKSILKEARQENQALQPQVREERQALHAAVKSDSLAQIDQITQQNMNLNSKVAANHVKAMARIYAVLTPDQRARFDQSWDQGFGHNRAARQSKGV